MLLSLENTEYYRLLFGMNDCNISTLEEEFEVSTVLRGQELRITGASENISRAESVIMQLLKMLRSGESIDPMRVRYLASMAKEGAEVTEELISADIVAYNHRGKPIRCKTNGQRQYVEAIRDHELTIAAGPAGTGKTYLAMALAVRALKSKEVERIILTRPAVEAGEKLGFLPGDMTQKIDPYLRPLYDALYDMLGTDAYQRLQERGAIEVAPLAFMRGRTLNNAFIILDEAQNTTCEQMKMFLTRLGAGSKCVVAGDISQTDLPRDKRSGLGEALQVLSHVSGVAIAMLRSEDVVRHELVQRIVKAYENFERTEKH